MTVRHGEPRHREDFGATAGAVAAVTGHRVVTAGGRDRCWRTERGHPRAPAGTRAAAWLGSQHGLRLPLGRGRLEEVGRPGADP